MNELIMIGATMSTREIAELTGKRNADVMRDVRKMMETLEYPESLRYDTCPQTKRINTYHVPLNLALSLVSGYDFVTRSKLIDILLERIENQSLVMDAIKDFDMSEIEDKSLYIIRNDDTGNLKIGISVDPYARLKALQTGCDGHLSIVATVDTKNGYQDESAIHGMMIENNIHGEWFDCSEERALEVINDIVGGGLKE